MGSIRRSIVFTHSDGSEEDINNGCGVGSNFGGFGGSENDDNAPQIRWRKGELIGCGAFGRVYMGMNLDSGELLAVKEVSIVANCALTEKTQTQITELEKEVNLLKNLSHPNIVRYLGTSREKESLNILLEFVPGGSISSLLGKFGSFPESVIRMYTKQLLLGLEYLHQNGIMHRDIKGANILVDNKGRIRLADFGASKKVVELSTMNGAKSMKGTPYWMAPEVVRQTGHNFSADIWSVGCTVIEMATGKPPWSQQYQEVAALFHIGTTKSHPPIPEHLSVEAKDFLLKCLQKEPDSRPSASDLLHHPFVTGKYQQKHPVFCTSVMDNSGNRMAALGVDLKKSMNSDIGRTCSGFQEVCDTGSVKCSTIYNDNISSRGSLWTSSNCDDDMCQIDDKDDPMLGSSMKFNSALVTDDFNKSFNPICEPNDEWSCKFDGSPELKRSKTDLFYGQTINKSGASNRASGKGDNDFTFPSGQLASEEDDEVTESKIIAFLDEKELEWKKLLTPLYEEFYNSLNAASPSSPAGITNKENHPNNLKLPPKSPSPNQVPNKRLSAAIDVAKAGSPSSQSRRISNIGGLNDHHTQDVQSPQQSEWKELLLDTQQEEISESFSEIQRKWKEELDQELERKREMLRQAGVAKTSSPKDRISNRQRDQLRFASPGK